MGGDGGRSGSASGKKTKFFGELEETVRNGGFVKYRFLDRSLVDVGKNRVKYLDIYTHTHIYIIHSQFFSRKKSLCCQKIQVHSSEQKSFPYFIHRIFFFLPSFYFFPLLCLLARIPAKLLHPICLAVGHENIFSRLKQVSLLTCF